MMELFRRLRRLNGDQRALLAEALILLICVRAGLRILPFSALRKKLASVASGFSRTLPGLKTKIRSAHRTPPERIAWAVNAVGRRLPGSTCLSEALAAESLLRRHGHSPTLRLGVHGGDAVPLQVDAHAWVECEGVVVIGRIDNLENYAVLS